MPDLDGVTCDSYAIISFTYSIGSVSEVTMANLDDVTFYIIIINFISLMIVVPMQ